MDGNIDFICKELGFRLLRSLLLVAALCVAC
jgi:hypothetical protein